jgi:hypothetical protein
MPDVRPALFVLVLALLPLRSERFVLLVAQVVSNGAGGPELAYRSEHRK